jgi:hypothetical protein
MDLACLDGVGPIVHHHIVIVADVRQAATHKQNSSFCNKDGLTQSSFQAFATNMITQSNFQTFFFKLLQQTWSYTVKLSSFCNKHGLTQSSFQAFATNIVLHIQAYAKQMTRQLFPLKIKIMAFVTNRTVRYEGTDCRLPAILDRT